MQKTEDQRVVLPHTSDEKICALCNKMKVSSDFYTKGVRIDSRCKSCSLAKKSERYLKGRRNRLTVKETELRAKKYRKEHGFPRLESYEECPVIVDVIHAPTLKTPATSDPVLIFHRKDTTVKEIAEIIVRKPKRLPRSLRKLDIEKVSNGKAVPDFQGISAPYGWALREGRLVPHRGEQWILERIEAELKANVDSSAIAKALNSARVKPRYAKVWIPQMVELVARENRDLKHLIHQSP